MNPGYCLPARSAAPLTSPSSSRRMSLPPDPAKAWLKKSRGLRLLPPLLSPPAREPDVAADAPWSIPTAG
ncbi:MAG: hypothetical protein K2H99_04500 [Paramuribaculum sp.]|nr:hypothetical protein [Paramuribaculum sp.]